MELPGKQNISALSIAGDGVTAVLGICNRGDGILQSCDIYQAEVSAGKIDNIVPLGRPINTEWWDGQPCISQDGQLLFFSSDRKGGHGGTDIYMCTKSEGKWSEPINLSFNSGGKEVAPFISKDNQTLYFASNDMPGGLGGYDIYMTRRVGQNEWTAPKNLGAAINSKGDEMFFYVPANEDAVYFSSERQGGEGWYDIYRVYVQPAPPKPKMVLVTGQILDAETGAPINTIPEVELILGKTGESLQNTGTGASYATSVLVNSLVKLKIGAPGYVSTSMEVQAPASNDAPYTQDIRLAPSHARIYGHVTNVFSHNPVATVLKLEQPGSTVAPVTVQTDAATGAYAFNINPSTSYTISTTAHDYEPYTTKVDVPAAREKLIQVEKEIRLTPSAIDNVMVNFETASSKLDKAELSKFERFIQQVKENPYVRIVVNGHTDDVGSKEYNEKLSERRAIAVEDYLLSRGVPRDQLAVVKGFGMSAPIDPSTSEEARAKNRRVEVRIVGKD
jgi:outer membrane protein OmpA-like peptidoglycan-associated protein